MKKVSFSAISIVLALLVLLTSISMFSATAEKADKEYIWSEDTPFIRYEDEQGIRYIGAIGNSLAEGKNLQPVFENAESSEEQVLLRDKAELASVGNSSALPHSVDLSTSKYFPPVGNQGGLGSCATFSTTYYQLSYEMNRQRDVVATAENTLSPQLVYNLMSTGDISGTNAQENYKFLKAHGAPSLGVLPYSDKDHLSWYPSEEIWHNAINSRVDEFYTLSNIGDENTQITSADDEDLVELKSTLANGNVVVFSAFIYSWVGAKIEAHPDAPENSRFLGEEIIKYQDGFNGSHSMLIVGYNDKIWVDQNSNGKVDNGEMGAFKIANSWGEGYANGGFCWVAYDALNKVSSVEGGFAGNRGSVMDCFLWMTVKPYGKGSEIYVRFTLNTTDRVQMNVDFSAEHNGIEESGKFLTSSTYRNDNNRFGFQGTEEAVDGTFCYALDNVSPVLCADNFDDYMFYATFEDTDADGKALWVKNVEIVNEHTGKVYKMNTQPFSLDGEEKTVLIKEAQTNDKTVLYIGYDEPMLHYKSGDGDFTSVKMEYTEAKVGHNYSYTIEDTEGDLTLYFTDENGNTDNNNGAFFKADDRLNFYRTENVRTPLDISGFEYTNGLPDINKRSYFSYNVTGGYEPYNYDITIEQLDTGKISNYPYDYRYDKSHAFLEEGKYRFTVEVRDQSGDTDRYEEIIDIINRPFVFTELSASSKYGSSLFVGENISFYAHTDFERIISRGPFKSLYEYKIIDENGKVVYTETVRSSNFHLGDCISYIYLDWIPEKKGDYIVQVSSTDDNKQYAEAKTAFSVFDKIYGDSDGDGTVSIKDATHIQKYVAELELSTAFCDEMADCNSSGSITVKDATCIRKYLAHMENTGEAGNIIEYIPPVTEPETTVTEATEPVTEPTPIEDNIVTFTNSHKWSGTISCYYWSDANQNMTTWPGKAMTNAGTNTFGETLYTFTVPEGAQYIIFTNGSAQTVDIPYSGGELKFYPLSETNSNGHYKVANW